MVLRIGGAVALLAVSSCVYQKASNYRLNGPVPGDADGFSNALYQAVGVKLVPGNLVEPIDNGAIFDALIEELKGAKQSIDIVVFIWRAGDPSDRLLPVITERVRAGVQCRIIADSMASNDFPERVMPTLEGAGCQVRLARDSFTIVRNHRKIFVIDGKVGFTGGVGIASEWLGNGRLENEWRDSNVRVRGPVVEQMHRAFAENWVEEAATLLPRTAFPELDKQGDSLAAFVSSQGGQEVTQAERLTHLAIAAAKQRVWIGNAYFAPSPGLKELIKQKRQHGVDVRFMGPSQKTDHPELLFMQRRHYDSLLAAGVRCFEYQPGMFHGKVMLVDESIAVVGSINLDKLSQDILDEGTLVVFDPAFVKKLETAWEEDQKRSSEILP